MKHLLTPEQIESRLGKLEVEWSVIGGGTLNRVYEFDDFSSALEFVNKVGAKAEKMIHHPEITLSWGKVVVNISTHSAGGLTADDFELAAAIG